MYKKRHVLRIISREMRAGKKLAEAIVATELRTKTTIYAWMNKNPRLKKWIKGLEALSDTGRNIVVENAFYERLKSGKATGAEYFFYLTNRLPDRWQNNFKFGDQNNTIITNIKYVRIDGRNSVSSAELSEPNALIEGEVQGNSNRETRR